MDYQSQLQVVNCPVVVNTDALNELSDAHRTILMESVGEAMAFYVANYNANAQAAWIRKLTHAT